MPGVSWTEKTAPGSVYQEGVPASGGPVRVLFGAIVFNQGIFKGLLDVGYTEKTVASSTYTEKTVTSSTWTEKTF